MHNLLRKDFFYLDVLAIKPAILLGRDRNCPIRQVSLLHVTLDELAFELP